MNVIKVVPHGGAGNIAFGMTRTEVERAVGRKARRMKRSELDVSEVDFFDGFAVFYDEGDRCCAVEFHRGLGLSVEYGGYDLFGHPAEAVRAWARVQDPDIEDTEGFVSKALGLSMYAPLIDEPDLDEDERVAPAQGFMVFRRGYYDRDSERVATQVRS